MNSEQECYLKDPFAKMPHLETSNHVPSFDCRVLCCQKTLSIKVKSFLDPFPVFKAHNRKIAVETGLPTDVIVVLGALLPGVSNAVEFRSVTVVANPIENSF